jgi:hypothetical protein
MHYPLIDGFPIRECVFYKTGLATPRCTRNNNPAFDSCEGECEYWRNRRGESHEDVLYRIVHSDDYMRRRR